MQSPRPLSPSWTGLKPGRSQKKLHNNSNLQILDNVIQNVTTQAFRIFGRAILRNGLGVGGGSSSSSSSDGGARVSVVLPTYPPDDTDYEDDEATQAASNVELSVASSTNLPSVNTTPPILYTVSYHTIPSHLILPEYVQETFLFLPQISSVYKRDNYISYINHGSGRNSFFIIKAHWSLVPEYCLGHYIFFSFLENIFKWVVSRKINLEFLFCSSHLPTMNPTQSPKGTWGWWEKRLLKMKINKVPNQLRNLLMIYQILKMMPKETSDWSKEDSVLVVQEVVPETSFSISSG